MPRHGGFHDLQLNVSFRLTLEMTDVCLRYPDLLLFGWSTQVSLLLIQTGSL